jgi:hypothetical protein
LTIYKIKTIQMHIEILIRHGFYFTNSFNFFVKRFKVWNIYVQPYKWNRWSSKTLAPYLPERDARLL